MKNLFASFIWEWGQLRRGFNWRTFHLVMIEFEDDRMTGGIEATAILLGVGVRVRWTYDTTYLDGLRDRISEIHERTDANDRPR